MTMSDAEWAARPCLREWTLRDRPCPWFTCGRDCEDTWADEAGAAFAAIRVAALAVLSALAFEGLVVWPRRQLSRTDLSV